MEFISINDIQTNPHYYLKNIINNTNTEFSLLYGPYIIQKANKTEIPINRDYHSPIFQFLNSALTLINLKGLTYTDGKKIIKDIMAKIMVHDKNSDKYRKTLHMLAFDYLKTLKDTQYREKLLESALISSSPIIPYNQYIKKSYMEAQYQIKYNNFPISYIIYILNYIQSAKLNLNDILTDLLCNNIIAILTMGENTYQIPSSPDKISSVYYNLPPRNMNDIVYARVYFFLAFVNYAFRQDQYRDIIEELILFISNLSDFKNGKIGTESIINYFINNISIDSINLESFSDESVKLMKFEQDKYFEEKVYETAIVTPEDSLFPIDELLSYIHTSFRFSFDRNNNSLFCNQNKINTNQSYLENNIMICQVNDLIYTPAIDLGNGNTPCIITLTKGGTIDVKNGLSI